MTNRLPLIVDSSSSNLKELPAGDDLNLSGSSFTANNVTVSTSFKLGSWEIKLDSNDLRFVYNGTDVCKITTTGNIIASGNFNTNSSP
jgi:hypothetical protein